MAGEVLVSFKPQATSARRDAVDARAGARVLHRFEAIGAHHLRLPNGVSMNAALAALRADADVVSAQPNYIRQIVATPPPNDPYWLNDSLWGLLKIQAPAAWTVNRGNASVIAAVIDTGVDYTHSDLAPNMWTNPGEVPGNGIDDDGNGYVDDVYGIDTVNHDSNPMDDNGHGTHTAGTIAAAGNNGVGVVGVNWNARVLACKFLSASGAGMDSAAIECFNYIVALKKRGVNIVVSSNSWGGPRDGTFPQSLKDAIDAAGNAEILNVFAAGNSTANIDTAPFDPASFTSPSIVSVAASDQSDNPASFSNYGLTAVDLAAPGVSIVSTFPGNSYGTLSGTSMAAPHVAGAAALLSSQNSGLTVAALKAALLNNVDKSSQWSALVASGGRLNVFSAMLSVRQPVPPSVSVTSPLSGATFTAPATIAVTASAADTDGTISRVDFYASGVLIGTDTTAPYSVSWTNVLAGSYAITAAATDNMALTTTSVPVTVTVTSTGQITTRTNVALASNGATASASSTYSSGYSPAGAINGDRNGTSWGAGGGWNDGTANSVPDWLRVDFAGTQTISEVDVFSVQDAYNAPSVPTPTMAFSQYGLTDFEVQYWTGTQWTVVPGGTISGNRLVWRSVTFAPVATTAIRVMITGAQAGFSRMTELEAYTVTTTGPPPPRTNVALASNGATASASSTYNAGFAPTGAINGDRSGASWGAGGGWNDGTANSFPDWLRVDFAGTQTISEVDVFSVQDAYSAPSAPTPTMPFSQYGLTDFEVQYWTGTQWTAVPAGTISGNRLVWRSVTFAPVTTTSIRIMVTGAMAGFSRVAEVEAYSGTASPPPPPTRTNVALASNGATVSASSTYSASYAPSGAINGDRNGASWGAGGGWNDGTANTFPDWLRVDFSGAQSIGEVDVFSVQDAYSAPSPPTPTMPFSQYGLTDFEVQYWTGTQWTTVPGGTISGNRLVWRSVTFAPVTTTSIRIMVTGAMAGFSRVAEVEAYSASAVSTNLIGFPPDNWWNLDISVAPVDSNSASYIGFIGGSGRKLHPDFGGEGGFPYVVVDGSTPKKAVQFQYAAESDGVDHNTGLSVPFYPIPDAAITGTHYVEGGQPGNVDLRAGGDRHMILLDSSKRQIYELFNVFYDGSQWLAGSGAFFDMNTNARRPDGWTSADAAGLAILPGLVRYEEVYGTGEIQHAFRVTVRATNGYVFPASHRAGSTTGALPMGARLRLKASKDLSGFSPEMQKVFRAMQRYGLVVADNGADMFISGTYNPGWDNNSLNPAFGALSASDFDVITLGYTPG